MRERRPDRLAKTEAKAKLAGGTPPADAPHRKDTRFIAGGPLTQRANGREKDKGIQQAGCSTDAARLAEAC